MGRKIFNFRAQERLERTFFPCFEMFKCLSISVCVLDDAPSIGCARSFFGEKPVVHALYYILRV